jgi:hypothetical protein
LAKLFHAASSPKRSKIGSFLRIVRALEDALHFPTQLNERNGLALAQALDAEPAVADRVQEALHTHTPQTAAEEAELISAAIKGPSGAEKSVKSEVKLPPALQELRTGLRIKETARGDIVLSGAVVKDPAFREALLAYLQKTDTN